MELLWENISDVQASVQYSMITGLAHCIVLIDILNMLKNLSLTHLPQPLYQNPLCIITRALLESAGCILL